MSKDKQGVETGALTPCEVDISRQIIEQARLKQPNSHIEYEAAWLLEGSIGDAIWRTTNGGKEILNEGAWYNTMDVSFDWSLPDGTKLTDNANKYILTNLQKWAFLLRSGHLGPVVGPRAWKEAVSWARNLTSWSVLNSTDLRPRERGFLNLDIEYANKLIDELSKGNWAQALLFIPRLYVHFHKNTFVDSTAIIIPDSLFNIDEQIKSSIIGMLKDNDCYGEVVDRRNTSQVSREYLAKALGTSKTSFQDHKVRAFLRQFEPELQHKTLLINVSNETLHPSQNTPLLENCIRETSTKGTLEKHVTYFKYFLLGSKFIPEFIPSIEAGAIDNFHNKSAMNCRRSTHHNLVPLSIGFNILNESMKWIAVYGESIIHVACDFLPKAIEVKQQKLSYKESAERIERILDIALANAPDVSLDDETSIPLSQVFNIQVSNYGRNKFDKPSFQVILQTLIGACAISIAFLKPSRDEEIENLARECIYIRTFLSQGAWIRMPLGKSGQLGVNTEIDRPIPSITVKGIQLLQKLGSMLCEAYKDKSKLAHKLFYIPFGRGIEKPRARFLGERINHCMNLLCDWANTPLDEHGRRWYLRTHEMRKLFLLMMFWYNKGHYYDTARWIAGHIDTRHTEAYLEANVQGEEISAIVAQIVDEKLIALELGKLDSEKCSGLLALYQAICQNFKVNSIMSIDEKHYFEYITGLMENGRFDVQPIAIFGDGDFDAKDPTQIAVRYEEIYDARFKIS